MGLLETIALIIFFIVGCVGLYFIIDSQISEKPASVTVNVTVTPSDTFKDEKNLAVKVGNSILSKGENIIGGAIEGAGK
jgi:hypothetical protein